MQSSVYVVPNHGTCSRKMIFFSSFHPFYPYNHRAAICFSIEHVPSARLKRLKGLAHQYKSKCTQTIFLGTSWWHPRAIGGFHVPAIRVGGLWARHLWTWFALWNRLWDEGDIQSRKSLGLLVADAPRRFWAPVPSACGARAGRADSISPCQKLAERFVQPDVFFEQGGSSHR